MFGRDVASCGGLILFCLDDDASTGTFLTLFVFSCILHCGFSHSFVLSLFFPVFPPSFRCFRLSSTVAVLLLRHGSSAAAADARPRHARNLFDWFSRLLHFAFVLCCYFDPALPSYRTLIGSPVLRRCRLCARRRLYALFRLLLPSLLHDDCTSSNVLPSPVLCLLPWLSLVDCCLARILLL